MTPHWSSLDSTCVLFCFLILGFDSTSSENYTLGIIDSSVDNDIFQMVDKPANFTVDRQSVTNFKDYNYMNIRKAHDELESNSVDALMGDYNSVYAAVAMEMKINYYVTSITPYDQDHTRYIYQIFPDAKVFSKAVMDLVEFYSFHKIAFIHDSFEGSVIMERILRNPDVEVQALKLEKATSDTAEADLRLELKMMRNNFFHTFIIVCNQNNTDRVLRQGLSLSLFSSPHKWLLVNIGLDEFDLGDYVDSRANLTVLRMMMDVESKDCSLQLFNMSLRRAVIHDAVQYCYTFWELLKEKELPVRKSRGVREEVNKRRVHGCTGYLDFNGKGRRTKKYLQLMTLQAFKTNQDPEEGDFYDVYETREDTERIISFDPAGTGTWSSSGGNVTKRVEPSRSYSRVAKLEENVFGDGPLRISTKIEPPFVQWDDEKNGFEGHLIDILEELSRRLNFKYNITLVPDGKFGSKKPPPRGWTGMVRQLVDNKADVALAPFQMSPSRSEVVDFSKPFMTKGTTVVIKKPEETVLRVFQFLSPLSNTVWIAIFVSFVFVSLVLSSVSRVNSDRQQKYTHNLRESFWYIWGTLLRGSLTGSPHAISSRIVASAWWFFCLIMISLYTANLAAFLTITNANIGIKSAADLAYQDYYEYGTVDGSQIEYFFKHTKMNHYEKMWAHMSTLKPKSMVRRVTDGFERVNKGKYAFIWDSPTIRHEISGNCSLMQIGHPFDLKGYGIAFKKDADFGDVISLDILRMKDEGVIYRLEGKWWRRQYCPDARASAKTKSLDVENVVGMFLVLAGGVGISGVLCFIKFCFTRPKIKKTKTSTYQHDSVDKEESAANDGYDRSTDIQVYANHSGIFKRSNV